MIAQKGEHTRASCKQRRIKTTTHEATHLDANGAPIDSACMPGIVGDVDHLRCLTPVPADHVVRRRTRPAQFEPSDGALVTTLTVVQHREIDARTATAREIWDGLQRSVRRNSVIGKILLYNKYD
jgi:hypothetical protein